MTEFSSSFEKKILQTLNRMAERVAEDAKSNAVKNNLPDVVIDAIEVGKVISSGNGTFSVAIRVDTDKAKMAAAYEFGSGIHATRGEKGKYKIQAGELGYLAFPITRWPNYTPPPNVKIAVFPGAISKKDYVMHPGVEARPYLTPALKSNVQITKLQLKQAFGEAFREVTPTIVLIKAK